MQARHHAQESNQPIESNPAFIYLVKNWGHLQSLDRATALQTLLNASHSGRHIAARLTAAGIQVDEGTVRRDSVVARLPESYKQLLRSGMSVAAVIKKAKVDGVLPELRPAQSSEDQQENAPASEKHEPVEEVPLDREAYHCELHARVENIGPALEVRRLREAEYRQRVQAKGFGLPADSALPREKMLERMHEKVMHLQQELDYQRQREAEYRARVRARQFGKTDVSSS